MHTSSTVPIATPAMMAAMVWSARSIGPIEDAPAEVAPERPPLQVAARERLVGLQHAGVEHLGLGRRDGCVHAAEDRRLGLGLHPLCSNLGTSCFIKPTVAAAIAAAEHAATVASVASSAPFKLIGISFFDLHGQV